MMCKPNLSYLSLFCNQVNAQLFSDKFACSRVFHALVSKGKSMRSEPLLGNSTTKDIKAICQPLIYTSG